MNTRTYHANLRNVWYTNDRTKHFEFEVSNGSRFDYQPGQYISMDVEVDGHKLVRAYSLASSPHHNGRFDLCLNIVPEGHVSPKIFDLAPGDRIAFRGPFGHFVLRQPVDPVSAFIATGTGIAPLRAMLQYLFGAPSAGTEPVAADLPDVWLIYGVRTAADILYREEFEGMARQHSNFHFVPTLSRPEPDWSGHTGYVQTQIERYLAHKAGFHAYICGLKKMVNDVRHQLRTMGYPPTALSCEKYD